MNQNPFRAFGTHLSGFSPAFSEVFEYLACGDRFIIYLFIKCFLTFSSICGDFILT